MATTTTNYGFDIPQSTDLVKDGATAIATLGQDIDTAMNTALGTKKAGMVLLNTTSFSGVASQSLPDNTFSSTYDDYYLIIKQTANTVDDTDVYIRLRTAGTNAITNYKYERQYNASSTNGADRDVLGTTFWPVFADNDSALPNYNAAVIKLFRPNLATPTVMHSEVIAEASGGGLLHNNFMGVHTTASAYDSLSIIVTSGAITGSIAVYGFNK